MIGTGGRARLTVIALEPLSVKATRYLAPMSRAVLHAPRAMASATVVARDAYGGCSKKGLVSASIAIRLIIEQARAGWSPVAVSPESMRQSVPEYTALATSLASARVGRVDLVIDWSISVATMTGRRTRRATLRIWRWMTGTRSGGNSTPRSPRATITPSLAATMLSRFSTASSVSILATTGVGAPHAVD